jgi:hypothetical protein
MDLNTISNLAQALAVIVALVFGVVQVRQLKDQRRREATFTLMQSLQTREMLHAMLILDSLPEGLGKAELQERLDGDLVDLQALLGTWESLVPAYVAHRDWKEA